MKGTVMTELYAAMMSWAVTISGYAPPVQMPDVVMVSHAVLVEFVLRPRSFDLPGSGSRLMA